jgi:hypothetical protein
MEKKIRLTTSPHQVGLIPQDHLPMRVFKAFVRNSKIMYIKDEGSFWFLNSMVSTELKAAIAQAYSVTAVVST